MLVAETEDLNALYKKRRELIAWLHNPTLSHDSDSDTDDTPAATAVTPETAPFPDLVLSVEYANGPAVEKSLCDGDRVAAIDAFVGIHEVKALFPSQKQHHIRHIAEEWFHAVCSLSFSSGFPASCSAVMCS